MTVQQYYSMADIFNHFDKITSKETDRYPFYNIVQTDENNWVIELALAGYTKSDIHIEEKDSYLTISGKVDTTNSSTKFVHQGISRRSFKKSFRLGEWMYVRNAKMENGILSVAIELVVPDEKKPKTITIN
jgi:molecular chaperone IbpA